MNLSYFPDDINFSNFDLFNLLNNQSFVQFLHRSLAYLIIVFVLFFRCKVFIQKKTIFLNNYLNVFFVLILQVLLGILTLNKWFKSLFSFITSNYQCNFSIYSSKS